MTTTLDPRATWVTVDRAPEGKPRWRLVQFAYQDERESGGRHNCYVTTLDANGAPQSGVRVWQKWPDAAQNETAKITQGGACDFGIYGGPFYPDRGERGAYWFYVADPGQSDIVRGVGLPVNRHVCYYLTFRWMPAGAPIPPSPTPPPGDVVTRAEFDALKRRFDSLVAGLRDMLVRVA